MDSISDMRVFVEVVRAGTFKGAAGRIGLTPSGVSRRLGRFEDRLGARLLHRTTRVVSLTEAGEVLFERGEKIIASLRVAESLVRDLSGTPKGHLRISATAALTAMMLIPFLKSFSAEFHEITTEFIPADSRIGIIDARIDLALMFEQPKETTFVSRRIFDDPWIICASPEYVQRHGAILTPEDLSNHNSLTLCPSSPSDQQWEFAAEGQPVTVHIESYSSGIDHVMREAVLQGLGVARLPHFLVCQDVLDGRLIPLLSEFWPRSERAIYAAYPEREYLPSKTRMFLDRLHAYMQATMIKVGG